MESGTLCPSDRFLDFEGRGPAARREPPSVKRLRSRRISRIECAGALPASRQNRELRRKSMRTRIMGLAILSSLVLLRPSASSAVQYKVDPAHTAVTFQVRHLFSKVNGRFDKFDGKIDFDPAQPEKTVVEGSIDVATINTNQEKRDNAPALEGLLPRREVPEDHLRQHRGVGRRHAKKTASCTATSPSTASRSRSCSTSPSSAPARTPGATYAPASPPRRRSTARTTA